MKQIWTSIAQAQAQGQVTTLATVVDGDDIGSYGLYASNGNLLAGCDLGSMDKTGLVATGNHTLYIEKIFPRAALVIFGGGHVAVPVARMGKMLGFEVIVNDDRREFANPQRFPQADQVLAMPHAQAFEQLGIGIRHYVVIVTRGHIHDRDCLVQALNTPAAYIGVIGSPKKAKEMRQYLRDNGYSEQDLARIFSPIGLDIGANTPAEIAVSIMAEIIQQRSLGQFSPDLGDIATALANKPQDETWALATIVRSQGSTPRGPGARMLIRPGASNIGTVGGGPGEKETEEMAQRVIEEKSPHLVHFLMDNALAAQQGAVCGGDMTVFIQPI